MVVEHSRNQSHDTVDQHAGCQFSTAQHVVANGDFVGGQVVGDSFVNAFVPAANQDEMPAVGQLADHFLGQLAALSREQDGPEGRGGAVLGSEAANGSEEGLRLEDHALPAPEGPVVDRPVAVTGVGSEVVNPDGNQVLPDSLPHHAELERALEEPRKDSDDIELEGFRSGHRL